MAKDKDFEETQNEFKRIEEETPPVTSQESVKKALSWFNSLKD